MSTPAKFVPQNSAASELARKVCALESPAAYPDRPASVVAIETHFAWVFLAGDYAYKLKKPSGNPLSDLRSLDARRRSCEEEVRLNRPLAQDIYLGVMPLTAEEDGRLRVGG